MAHKIRTLSGIGVLISLLWVAACGSPVQTSSPTVDSNHLRTEVAATVLAQVTQSLILTPSVTPLPSLTATTPPTSTATRAASPSPSGTPTLASGTPQAGTVDQAEWVSQSVADDSSFAPGETFSMTWRLKNVGTSTWTAGYLLRFYSGVALGSPNEIPLGREVQPGETVDITIQMSAPAKPGDYRSDWVMSTENRSNFKEPVFLKIKVITPVTPTPTPSPA